MPGKTKGNHPYSSLALDEIMLTIMAINKKRQMYHNLIYHNLIYSGCGGGMSEHEKFTKELLYIMPELFREFSLGKCYFLSNI